MLKITKVKPSSLGKIVGMMQGFLGLFMGIFVLLATLLGFESETGGSIGFGIFSVVLFPILYGVGGFVAGLITAFLFNFCSKQVGGLELETAAK